MVLEPEDVPPARTGGLRAPISCSGKAGFGPGAAGWRLMTEDSPLRTGPDPLRPVAKGCFAASDARRSVWPDSTAEAVFARENDRLRTGPNT
jgi:hypothetical protein